MANSNERQYWIEAAATEISEIEGKNTWLEVPILDAKSKILPRTWVFHHKCTPNGTIKKYKACCVI
jgi:hypothetical protein